MAFNIEEFIETGLRFGGQRTSNFDIKFEVDDNNFDFLMFHASEVNIHDISSFRGCVGFLEDEDMKVLNALKTLKSFDKVKMTITLYSKIGYPTLSLSDYVRLEEISTYLDWGHVDEKAQIAIWFVNFKKATEE